jgi:hypothetical protein
MAGLPPQLLVDLRFRLGLKRAVETGTFRGDSAAWLASLFPEVVTIELSPELAAAATERFASAPHVRVVQGESGRELGVFADPLVPTLYFLDAHWSGGPTAGREIDCPIRDELAALEAGVNARDCVIVDDAHLFERPPPEGRDPSKWPRLPELEESLEALYPVHDVAVIDDQVIATPPEARPVVDAWATTVRTGKRPLRAQAWRLSPARLRWRTTSRML